MKFEQCPLSLIFDSVSNTFPFENKDKVIFLNTSDVLEGRVLHSTYSLVSELPGQAKKSIRKGDILYSEIRPKNKRFAFIDFDASDYVVSTKFMVLRMKESVKEYVDLRYVYYYITSDFFIDHLQFIAESRSGTFPQITFKDFASLSILLPKIDVQKKIAKFLDNISNKITINQLIITNLEQLAQTLFKHWFIDFEFPNENGEPYKSSGGKMVQSELGEIPEGWEIGTLNDLGEIVGGGTPSKKVDAYYTKQGIPWITPKDLSNNKSIFIKKGAIDITKEALEKSSAKLLPKNTVLFSSRAPIGYVAIAGAELATNQGFKSIIPKDNIPTEFVFFLLKYLTPFIEANAGGSTFKEISASGMRAIKTIIPPTTLLLKYKEIVNPLFMKIEQRENENRILKELRDTLLPKLLSGEIELPDESGVTEHVHVQ